MYEAIESIIDTETGEYVLEILSAFPISKLVTLVGSIFLLHAYSRISDRENTFGRSARMSILISFGVILFITALAFVNLSGFPTSQFVVLINSVTTLYKSSRVNDKKNSSGRAARIGIFIGIGVLFLIAALAFVNNGPDVIEIDLHDQSTLGMLLTSFVLFWFLLGAFLFNANGGQKNLVSEVDISRKRG
ncbi:hypothetical protein N7456_008675 [Penicillium angulare]|uniref:Uncharacterized protein n=1 Tax=Penicillium angulare TaxID=116970 RepID=A0A9W9F3B6_9EURO|nr:hypothetical protein N7456_008675 [Penicillium angulare]